MPLRSSESRSDEKPMTVHREQAIHSSNKGYTGLIPEAPDEMQRGEIVNRNISDVVLA